MARMARMEDIAAAISIFAMFSPFRVFSQSHHIAETVLFFIAKNHEKHRLTRKLYCIGNTVSAFFRYFAHFRIPITSRESYLHITVQYPYGFHILLIEVHKNSKLISSNSQIIAHLCPVNVRKLTNRLQLNDDLSIANEICNVERFHFLITIVKIVPPFTFKGNTLIFQFFLKGLLVHFLKQTHPKPLMYLIDCTVNLI